MRALTKSTTCLLGLCTALALLVLSSGCTSIELGNRTSGSPSIEILWDTWGVPHIYAQDDAGLAYAFGWAQMHSHGSAILKLYGLARGRAAEYWGEDYIRSDRFVHTMGIPDAGVEGFEAQTLAFRRYLDAFVDGINAYAARFPDAIDPGVHVVLPIRPEDVLAHSQRIAITFAALSGDRAELVGFDGMPPSTPPASNAWALGPSRTLSGNAMLLQNPHLPWHVPLLRFFEAHLIGRGVNVYGATLLGIPVPGIAFNEYLGWTHTVNTVDVLDTYALTRVEYGYLFDGEVRPFDTQERILNVRTADGSLRSETLQIHRSVHGPVMEIEVDRKPVTVAVRTPVINRHQMFDQYWEMCRATNLDAFESALRRMQIPLFNVIYADRDGRIFYLFNGQIPERPSGSFDSWQEPVPGDTTSFLWNTTLPYEVLPRVVDPPGGFLQHANSPPWYPSLPSPLKPRDFPDYLAPDFLYMREIQSLEILLASGEVTLDDFVRMRHSTDVLLADRILDDLILAAREIGTREAEEAALVLEAWDRRVEPESRGAVLFLLWAQTHCRGGVENPCGFDRPWNAEDPLRRTVSFRDPASAVSSLERAIAYMRERIGPLDTPWGLVMRLSDELPGRGAPGDPLGVFQVVSYVPGEEGFRPLHGDTWVAAIEFTQDGPQGRVLMSYGNATQASSPHRDDQHSLLAHAEMRPLWFTREDVTSNLSRREILDR